LCTAGGSSLAAVAPRSPPGAWRAPRRAAVRRRAGNNAVEMQTTATFDAASDEFVVHSPTVLSQKYWITNGAIHAKWAVVFCQLLIGGANHGVHGLLVRIREEARLTGPAQRNRAR